jgi:hypothetical protein
MPGTVNPIVPLSLLEAVRTVDIPEGDDVEVEYVQEHRNKRLGLSETVIAQIRRYKEALKRNQQIAIDEAVGIARLIGRRPDAEQIFTRAGSIVANRMYMMISATRRQIIHLLPGFMARPLAFRQVKKAGNKYLGTAPKGIGCLYYESALREMLRLLVNGGGMIDHVHCRERGEDTCEWRAEWRAVKSSQQ